MTDCCTSDQENIYHCTCKSGECVGPPPYDKQKCGDPQACNAYQKSIGCVSEEQGVGMFPPQWDCLLPGTKGVGAGCAGGRFGTACPSRPGWKLQVEPGRCAEDVAGYWYPNEKGQKSKWGPSKDGLRGPSLQVCFETPAPPVPPATHSSENQCTKEKYRYEGYASPAPKKSMPTWLLIPAVLMGAIIMLFGGLWFWDWLDRARGTNVKPRRSMMNEAVEGGTWDGGAFEPRAASPDLRLAYTR